MKIRRWVTISAALCAAAVACGVYATAGGARPVTKPEGTGYTLTAWNNLGMHCMDPDYAVFSILPPYNSIYAQLVDPAGHLVKSAAGITVTYQGVADPTGSINVTSAGKTNFWTYVLGLYGASVPVDYGLAGKNMPGAANTPQPMTFDPAMNQWGAEGIPLTPFDDAAHKNPYPMMRLVAKDGSGSTLATVDIVLPVSDEMDCSLCHASNSDAAAKPPSGWVNDPDPVRDYRLNVLRLHDDLHLSSPAYRAALATAHYNSSGLYANAATDGKPILCAACHPSNALPGTGQPGIPQETLSVHAFHASVVDPVTGQTLDASTNRAACYRCHPGSTTRCLRGAMGSAVAADGTLAMQCQSCHGSMSQVGLSTRQGWLNEPQCGSCHTGTAVDNSGLIRYTSAFDPSTGQWRVPANTAFSTNPDTPAPGLNLYRFSKGHGGLQCEGCHGSTHAEYISSHESDNLASVAIQGHVGKLAECTVCHATVPSTVTGGPHGMHPVGQPWVQQHHTDGMSTTGCKDCHGTDYRGTVLSRSQGNRSIDTGFGIRQFWQGYQIGCYTCHGGPSNDNRNPNRPPTANGGSAVTGVDHPVTIPLTASDPQAMPLTLRIVSQAKNGTVGLSGRTATYIPLPGYQGQDSFTFAASNGQLDSNLAAVQVNVGASVQPPIILGVSKVPDPFRLKITGNNFQAGAAVFIGSDVSPWGTLSVKSATQIMVKQGSALKAKFPPGVAVPIRVVNPDGGSATGSYTAP
jgi:hypothetical protein